MKNIFLFIVMALSISSCNTSKLAAKYLTDHDFKEVHSFNPATGETNFYASIDSLYDFSKVEQFCDTADVTFHISQGKIEVEASCDGAGQTLVEIFKKVISYISFSKP